MTAGWHQAPEVAWDRNQRLTQYTPDTDWGSPVRPRVTHRLISALLRRWFA